MDLHLDPDRTLPGLTVPLRVTVHNRDVRPFTVTEYRVRIATSEGDRFFARWSGGRDYRPPDAEDETTVLRGQSKTLSIPMKDFFSGSGEWMSDPRLYEPGEYRIAVLVRDGSRKELPSISSSELRLVIQAPQGADAWIWRRIRNGDLFRGSLANEVFENSPESAYMPALATLIRRVDPVEKIRAIERVNEIHPQSPFRSFLLLTLAGMYQGQANLVIANGLGDPDAAEVWSDRAHATAAKLLEDSDPWIRGQARKLAEEMPSREYYRALQETARTAKRKAQ